MISVKQEFEKRVQEIEHYFMLLDSFFDKGALLYFPNKKTHRTKKVNPELEKVLKANCFLLLYNLIESSIKMSLTEIYDNISSKGVDYKDVIDEIKRIWIKERYSNFKNLGEDNIFNLITCIDNDTIQLEFNSDKVISGNIDREKITEFATKIGFAIRVHYSAGTGEKLHQVKTRRNNLAHGNISFSECGREFTLEDLVNIKIQVIRYLRQILKNIEQFLTTEEYLI